MIAVDTSVIVAGLSTWHDRHEDCRAVLDERPDIAGHALVEAFSVLTRLPAPYRVQAQLAAELLTANFAGPPLIMGAELLVRFVGNLPEWNVLGGAVYDALIAVTAREVGATLLTLDARALRTYHAVGADGRLI